MTDKVFSVSLDDTLDVTGLFDTHAHYFDRMFEGSADELLEKLFSAGLDGVINVGTSNKKARADVRCGWNSS